MVLIPQRRRKMTLRIFAILALSAGVGLATGCDSAKRNARAGDQAIKTAPATLEDVFSGKTPAGEPVRVYKITLQAPNGEHLLMVVGETTVPVSLKNASTVKVGDQEFSEPGYLPVGNGQVFVLKTSGSQCLTSPFSTEFNERISSATIKPDSDAKPTFPMALLKAKVSGQTLNLPALDKL
jgi:hypothetical protein